MNLCVRCFHFSAKTAFFSRRSPQKIIKTPLTLRLGLGLPTLPVLPKLSYNQPNVSRFQNHYEIIPEFSCKYSVNQILIKSLHRTRIAPRTEHNYVNPETENQYRIPDLDLQKPEIPFQLWKMQTVSQYVSRQQLCDTWNERSALILTYRTRCVECPQYSIWLKMLSYLYTSCLLLAFYEDYDGDCLLVTEGCHSYLPCCQPASEVAENLWMFLVQRVQARGMALYWFQW